MAKVRKVNEKQELAVRVIAGKLKALDAKGAGTGVQIGNRGEKVFSGRGSDDDAVAYPGDILIVPAGFGFGLINDEKAERIKPAALQDEVDAAEKAASAKDKRSA